MLNRKAYGFQHLTHMARVIGNAEFFVNHIPDHDRSPYAAVEPVCDRSAFDDVCQKAFLLFGKSGWPPAPMPFEEAVFPVEIPVFYPRIDCGAVGLEQRSDFA